MKIYTVLKTGVFHNKKKKVQYLPEHVIWMRDQCAVHAKGYEFVCLSDVQIPTVQTIKLEKNWEGWWSKIELFRFTDVFYLDLDTVLLNDIRHLLDLDGFYALNSMSNHRDPSGKLLMGSGVMSWKGDYSHVYNGFDPKMIPTYSKDWRRWGDQGYIGERVNSRRFQDDFPKSIYSYKFSGIDIENPPGDIICFHGNPKPWDTDHAWVPRVKSL
jgi:hypothetical protein